MKLVLKETLPKIAGVSKDQLLAAVATDGSGWGSKKLSEDEGKKLGASEAPSQLNI